MLRRRGKSDDNLANGKSQKVLHPKDPQSHRITDFFSFYSLPSTVINNTKYPVLEAAYLYYYGTEVAFAPEAEKDNTLQKRLQSLIGDALVVAKGADFDVFNTLTLMDNVSFLKDLKVNISHSK